MAIAKQTSTNIQTLRTPNLPGNQLWWVEDFLCAGSSSLLLLFARLHAEFSLFYLLALVPYFWQVIRASFARSIYLGTALASSYVFIAYANNLLIDPSAFLLQFLCFNLIFVSYGIAVSRARQVYGINPLLLFFLWLPIEYALNHLAGMAGLLSLTQPDSNLIFRFSTFFNILIVPLVIVLLNPLLLLLTGFAVEQILSRLREPLISYRKKYYLLIQSAFIRRWYYFPDFRSPPSLLIT